MNRPSIADSVRSHEERNRHRVELIKSKRADLEVERTIDLHFWASSEDAARGLVAELQAAGLLNVKMNPEADEQTNWNVEGQVRRSVRQVVAHKFVERLVQIAEEHDSTFDGWGTPL